MVAGLVLVPVVLAAWVIAKQQLRSIRRSAAELLPVPAPRPRPAEPRPPGSYALEVRIVTSPQVRRCGHCRGTGHTRTLCPQLTGALTLPHL